MKKKEEKTAAPTLSVNEVGGAKTVCLPTNHTASAGSRWLKVAIGEDLETREHQANCLVSENFLQTQLYPLVDSDAEFNVTLLVELLVEYKRNIKQAGRDFELSNVVGSILNRFELYSGGNANNTLSQEFEMLNKDVTLLEILSEMDLQTVDMLVKQRICGK
ncbi:MAG: hypothetical protein HY863_09735 [Chloroflexi bacterium]|nr:hypothetical protein [Chloroflexota bacterium]